MSAVGAIPSRSLVAYAGPSHPGQTARAARASGSPRASLGQAKRLAGSVLRAARRLTGRRGHTDPAQAKRILFLDYETALGFAAMNTATYAALKKARPDVHVGVLTTGLGVQALAASPFVDELIVTDRPTARPAQVLRAVRRLRRAGALDYDAVVLNGSGARIAHELMTLLLPSATSVGAGPLGLYDVEYRFAGKHSVLANTLGVLKPLGGAASADPRIFYDQAALARAKALIAQGVGTPDAIRIGLVTQTSGGHPNTWFDDRFAEVAKTLSATLPVTCIFFGTAADRPAIDAIRQQIAGPSVSLAGETSLTELAACLTQCDLLVSLDTGTLHVARGTDVPTVVIAPAHQPDWEWLPLGRKHIRILRRDDIACRECRKFSCATLECMDELTAADVIQAAGLMLARFPASAAARDARGQASLSLHHPLKINGS